VLAVDAATNNIGSLTVLHRRVRVQAVSQEPQQIHRFSTIWAQRKRPSRPRPAAAVFRSKPLQKASFVQAAALRIDHVRAGLAALITI
jgi:hypothetical protein